MHVRWTVSVVSHGHGASVTRVLRDVHHLLRHVPHRLVLTLNIAEDDTFIADLSASLKDVLTVIRNAKPHGFGRNHNAALRRSDSDYVLIADPDLAVPLPVFGALELALTEPRCGIVSPLALAPDGSPEDNGRSAPSLQTLLLRRALGRRGDRMRHASGGARQVDWVAGLFMAMRTDTFRLLHGFDERYYMYCEDVDLCLRARSAGLTVMLLSNHTIVHDARRASSRKVRHLAWHIASLARLWTSPAYAEVRRRGKRQSSAPSEDT